MTDDTALRAAILAAPEDDAPRLVYADWLDEHGQPERAEFVRVQVELARIEADAEAKGMLAARVDALRRREGELLGQHWSAWIRGAGLVPEGWKLSTDGDTFHVWRDEPFDDGFRFLFRRGFVASVACSASDWLAHGDTLLAAQPVTAVTLTTELLPLAPGFRTGVWGDPAERWFTSEDLNAVYRPGDRLIDNLLRCRWPTVGTWTLPGSLYREAEPD